MGAVDATHAEGDGGNSEGAGVVQDVLIGGALGAAIGGVERKGAGLIEPLAQGGGDGLVAAVVDLERDVLEVPVDLVRGGENEPVAARRAADGLEEVEGAAGVDVEIGAGVGDARRDRDLGGEVENGARAAKAGFDRVWIADVAETDLETVAVARAEPGEVSFHAGAGDVVEDAHAAPLGKKMVGEVATDEARAAGDENRAVVEEGGAR